MSRFASARASHQLIYLAPTPLHALLEVQALVRSFHAPAPLAVAVRSYVLFAIAVHGVNVVDLGDPGQRTAVAASAQELTGDWRAYPFRRSGGNPPSVRSNRPDAPTQELGASLHSVCAIDGFLAPSAHDALVSNLVVFPSKVCADPASRCIRPCAEHGPGD